MKYLRKIYRIIKGWFALKPEPVWCKYKGVSVDPNDLCKPPHHGCASCSPSPVVKKGASVLAEADELINGDRQASYGHPLDDYTRTANTFNALTGYNLTALDAITFMICVKLSRERHHPKRDNRVDAAGYVGCYDKALMEMERRQQMTQVLKCRKPSKN